MAMEQIRPLNVHLITASTVATFTVAATAARNVNVFLGSDIPFGVASDCVFFLFASQGLATQNATLAPVAAGRWHPGSFSTNSEITAFTHGFAQAYQFASGSLSFAQSGSANLYFPATTNAENQNVRFHPPFGAFVVQGTLSNSSAAAVTHTHTLMAAFMIQGR